MDLADESTTTPPQRPYLSVVLATIDDYGRIRKTVECLKRQTIRDRLEILLVASTEQALGVDEDLLPCFFDVRVIAVGEIDTLSEAKVRAVRASRADLVVFAEDHSWPDPKWAESIVEAHEAGYVAVGPRVRNANPGSMLSWANYLACFGRWSDKSPAGEVDQTPWHNTSYRRQNLLDYESELPRLLAAEGVLQDRLRNRGLRLFLLPDNYTDHVNISRWSSWVRHSFWGGKLFGGSRSAGEQWGILRRAVYIFGSPLIPFLRFKRLGPEIEVYRSQVRSLAKLLPLLMLSFIVHAIGEASGYVLGTGSAAEHYLEFEARRFEALDEKDRIEFGFDSVTKNHV
jgi:glycosyltransferase involved in cell wall biosynthesis